MPDWIDAQHALSEAEAVQAMLNHSARSLGIFRASWLTRLLSPEARTS